MSQAGRLVILVLVLWSSTISAAEIDSVTSARVELGESLADINRIFRERIDQGVARANARAGGIDALSSAEFCDEEILYTEMRKAIFNTYTASWGLKGYQLDLELRDLLAQKSYRLSLNDSIYRDITYLEGFSLNLKELSAVVRAGGHLVGIDKLGHMFAEGWHYFSLVREDGLALAEAMAWGREQEEGKFGYRTTGIFSYADLTANLHGYRFWNRILGKRRDPLKSLIADWLDSSYVDCRIRVLDSLRHRKLVRQWQVTARFDLADYIDGAWDENNNCISFADPAIEAKVRGRIAEVDAGYRCPQSAQQCAEARSRYGVLAKSLLHPACLTAETEGR